MSPMAVSGTGKKKKTVSDISAKISTSKTLDGMRSNPKGDWTISDVERLCREIGIVCSPPSNGSHYKVSATGVSGILTVPARKPIKAVYIKRLVGLCDAYMANAESKVREKSDE